MPTILLFIHIVLCALAIYLGAIVLSELIMSRFSEKPALFFLRCSLGSSIAALLFQLDRLLPSQRVAMVAVYGSGLAVLAWRKFQLRGVWRAVFAFTISFVLYLEILAVSIQVFTYNLAFNNFTPSAFQVSQFALAAVFVLLGVLAARRFSGWPLAWPIATQDSLNWLPLRNPVRHPEDFHRIYRKLRDIPRVPRRG